MRLSGKINGIDNPNMDSDQSALKVGGQILHCVDKACLFECSAASITPEVKIAHLCAKTTFVRLDQMGIATWMFRRKLMIRF